MFVLVPFPVIPGRAEGANPESRGITETREINSGFRVRRFAAPRNDKDK
jgi:hypothetical protein